MDSQLARINNFHEMAKMLYYLIVEKPLF